jgi:hypothetical protein
MAYDYDFFLSYPRRNPVGDWVRNHFSPELRQWLDSYASRPGRVFVDEDLEGGDYWPNRLEEALRSSMYMVAVWSPQYFTSAWCCAEWRSMRQREDLLGLRSGATGLIFPVVFSDGRSFPAEAGEAQRVDFSDLNYPMPEFRVTAKYLDFVDRIKQVCMTLANWVDERQAPRFDPQWPVVRPPPHVPPVAELPRIE